MVKQLENHRICLWAQVRTCVHLISFIGLEMMFFFSHYFSSLEKKKKKKPFSFIFCLIFFSLYFWLFIFYVDDVVRWFSIRFYLKEESKTLRRIRCCIFGFRFYLMFLKHAFSLRHRKFSTLYFYCVSFNPKLFSFYRFILSPLLSFYFRLRNCTFMWSLFVSFCVRWTLHFSTFL